MKASNFPWWTDPLVRKKRVIVTLPLLVFMVVGMVVLGLRWQKDNQSHAFVQQSDCASAQDITRCYHDYYEKLVESSGAKQAMASLRVVYNESTQIQADCHQLTHTIGRKAAKIHPTVTEAYAQGDEFCWSGYYHGVMEAIISDIGSEKVAEQIDTICKGVSEGQRYSFYHYNCVHGLGHGAMLITSHELFQALDLCDKLSDGWEQSSCWGGAFMENIMADVNPLHSTKYLSANQPLYPCTAVAVRYKTECYKMQTSHALNVMEGSFVQVFELCDGVETPHRATCYQSIGRDASGRSISQVDQTRVTCLLGRDFEARSNCIDGAVRDFISYYHDDTKAKELCASLKLDLQTSCQSTAQSYYSLF